MLTFLKFPHTKPEPSHFRVTSLSLDRCLYSFFPFWAVYLLLFCALPTCLPFSFPSSLLHSLPFYPDPKHILPLSFLYKLQPSTSTSPSHQEIRVHQLRIPHGIHQLLLHPLPRSIPGQTQGEKTRLRHRQVLIRPLLRLRLRRGQLKRHWELRRRRGEA